MKRRRKDEDNLQRFDRIEKNRKVEAKRDVMKTKRIKTKNKKEDKK